MSTDPFRADDERAGYEWLAQEVTPPGGAEGLRQLKRNQRNHAAVDERVLAVWRHWVTQTAIVIAGALLGLIVDAALTNHWDRFDRRILVLLIVGVMLPVVIYSKMVQIHDKLIIVSSMISRQLELAMMRHDPTINAVRWAFVMALPAATCGAALQSRDATIGYTTAIGCETLLLAVYWLWRIARGWREQRQINDA